MTASAAPGKLYLIPTLLGGEDVSRCIPAYNIAVIRSLRHFVVEDLRSARRFLRKADPSFPIDQCTFNELNEHTRTLDSRLLLAPIETGESVGLMSEAGLPCIADPGADLVAAAQERHIQVVPLIGPSSIFSALMASGLCGQRFSFHGYLPKEKPELLRKIRRLESDSARDNAAQIFIETPYKNNQMWELLIQACQDDTMLCVAANITLDNEYIVTKTVRDWQKSGRPDLHRQPALFIIQR